MVTYEIPKELIVKQAEGTKHFKYQVTIFELGFYIRIEQSDDGNTYKLLDVTTRNQPSKVKNFLNGKLALHKADDFRVLKSTEQKAYYNQKTRRYSHARTSNI